METPAIPFPNSHSVHVSRSASCTLEARLRTSIRLIGLSTLLLFPAASIIAQQPTPQPPQPISLADAAQRGQAIFQQSGFTGMVLVVVRNREVLIKGYGETAPGSGRAPDAHSEIRLCSLSKVFATNLLAQLAAESKVSITDPLQRYAPPRARVPEGPKYTPITLLDLATHTSGLAREVSAYPRKTPHFTFPSHAVRWAWLPKQVIKTPPGTVALYSNVGFDFLGDALASAAGMSYAQLLHDRILQPLGMWDTTLYPSPEQCNRLLMTADDQGPCTSTEASGASGGIYSTPTDMVKFLQYLLQLPGSPAQPAGLFSIYLKPEQLKSVQGLSHAGDPTGIGLAWIQLGDPATPSVVLQKTGGGGGFTTYIALNPGRQTAVFLALTQGKHDWQNNPFEESNALLADLAGVPPVPLKVHPALSPKRRPSPPAKPHSKRRRPTPSVRN